MESVATLAILRAPEGYVFHLEAPADSPSLPGQPAHAPAGLSGFTRLEPGLRVELEQAIDAAAEMANIIQPGTHISTAAPDPSRTRPLERLGRLLFSFLPLTLQQALSALPDRLPLILATDDPELPWELLHDGVHHLALTHPLARRWLITDPARHTAGVEPGRRTFLFISNPEGDLQEADHEAQILMDAFDSAPEMIDTGFLGPQQATRFAVQEALASGHYAVIHYSGHARPGALKLADGELTADEIQKTLRGRPFIFLSACRSARAEESPTEARLPYAGLRVRSLASAFLLGGASGFIGSLWKVFDAGSRRFAERFYALARQGVPVGEALRRTRAQTWPDPLWAAFVFYGDPTLRLAGLERREVRPATALVARLSGRLHLFERLDLESAADVESRLVALLSHIAERYGGQVQGPMNESLCVCFGFPRAHGNDPERAIRAALEMVNSLRVFDEPLLATGSVRLGLHVGIGSGQMVGRQVQTGAEPVYHLAGRVAEIAARLAACASEGHIFVDEETYRQAQVAFTFDAAELLSVIDGGQPTENALRIQAYPVRAARGAVAPAASVIGRDRELAQLRDWWQEASHLRQGRVVGLVGAAGVGKTSIVHAFRQTLLGAAHRWVMAVCQSYDQDTPYSLLAQVVTGLMDLMPEDDEATRRAKVETQVRQMLTGAEVTAQLREGLAILGQVIGMRFPDEAVESLDPNLRQRKLVGVLQTALAWHASQHPLVVCLEDLQWLDEASLAVLNQIVGVIGPMPVLMLAVYRSDWIHEWTRWGYYRHLGLEELDENAQRTVLASQLGVEKPPEALAQAVLGHTGGNPLFIEAVIRSLRESRKLIRSEEGWRLEGDAIRVPDQVESVILARLDQLEEPSRAILQTAAVIGPVFEYPVLETVLDVAQQEHLDESLRELRQRELIFEAGGWWPNVKYAFRHSLIHQTTYTHVLEGPRCTLHRRVAQVLQRLHPYDEESALERLAHHYFHSDDRVNAIRYCLRAARQAAEAWANRTARSWYGRALETIQSFERTPAGESEHPQETTPAQIRRWQIEALDGLGEVLVANGQHDEAIEGYQRALELAAGVQDFPVTRQANLDHKLAVAYLNQGMLDAAEGALNEGLKALDGLACLEAGRLQVWTGMVLFRRAKFPEGLAACEQGIMLIEPTASLRDLAQAYNLQGIIHRNIGNSRSAIRAHVRSIALYEQIQYLPGLERAYTNLGCVYQDAGRWGETLRYFHKSAALSDRIGEERRRAAANINLGEVYYLTGELDQAIVACEQALQLAREFGFNDHIGIASLNLGKSCLKQGDLAQAERYLEESLEICRRFHMEVYVPEILRYRSELGMRQGRLAIALNDAQEAMALADTMGPREVGLAHRSLGVAYRESAQLDLANVHLTQSLSILEEQHIPYEVGLTLVELARLRKAQSETGSERETLRAQGIAYCEQAIRIFDQLGADWDLRMAREVRLALEE